MSKHLNSRQKPERLVFIVGLTIGLSILGDSFLYGNLPIEAENLGIALPLVGILLSANRYTSACTQPRSIPAPLLARSWLISWGAW